MALLDHIGWEPTSTRTRFPISMPAERLQQVIRPLLEYTRDAVASPENTEYTHDAVTRTSTGRPPRESSLAATHADARAQGTSVP
jgi:hypothetical protein